MSSSRKSIIKFQQTRFIMAGHQVTRQPQQYELAETLPFRIHATAKFHQADFEWEILVSTSDTLSIPAISNAISQNVKNAALKVFIS